MGTPDLPWIGYRCDAIDLLEQLIEDARANTSISQDMLLGLEALKDVLVREAI